jgi:hypothetical protein
VFQGCRDGVANPEKKQKGGGQEHKLAEDNEGLVIQELLLSMNLYLQKWQLKYAMQSMNLPTPTKTSRYATTCLWQQCKHTRILNLWQFSDERWEARILKVIGPKLESQLQLRWTRRLSSEGN